MPRAIFSRRPRVSRDPPTRRIRWRAQSLIRAISEFFRLSGDAVCGYMGEGMVAVLKGCGRGDLLTWIDRGHTGKLTETRVMRKALETACNSMRTYLGNEIDARLLAAIGRYYPGIEGLAASYADAAVALEAAKEVKPQTTSSLCSI